MRTLHLDSGEFRAGAFIFDLDGTLYDSGLIAPRLVFGSLRDTFVIHAERRTRKSLAGSDFGSAASYYAEFFSRLGKAVGRFRARGEEAGSLAGNWYFNRYMPLMLRTLEKQYRPRPDAETVLKALTAEGCPIAIYSDYPRTPERLRALGLEAPPGCRVYGPENFGAQKPAPRPFLSIAADLGAAPGETLVVGDRLSTDGKGAAAAGMGFFRIKKDADMRNLLGQLLEGGEKA